MLAACVGAKLNFSKPVLGVGEAREACGPGCPGGRMREISIIRNSNSGYHSLSMPHPKKPGGAWRDLGSQGYYAMIDVGAAQRALGDRGGT